MSVLNYFVCVARSRASRAPKSQIRSMPKRGFIAPLQDVDKVNGFTLQKNTGRNPCLPLKREVAKPQVLTEGETTYLSNFSRFIGSAIRILSLSRLRRQLPSAVALLPAASATSPRETFGFQRGAAGTLLRKVSGAYHQVEPGERRNPCILLNWIQVMSVV